MCRRCPILKEPAARLLHASEAGRLREEGLLKERLRLELSLTRRIRRSSHTQRSGQERRGKCRTCDPTALPVRRAVVRRSRRISRAHSEGDACLARTMADKASLLL